MIRRAAVIPDVTRKRSIGKRQQVGLQQSILVVSLCLALVWGPTVLAQRIQRRAPATPVFLPAPRELTRELSRASEDADAGRYVDALTRLDFILNGSPDGEPTEDYFLTPSNNKVRKSLQREAERVIANLPEEGRRAYELAYGTQARKQLEQALTTSDTSALEEISRRYGHTLAGEDASLLLGRKKLVEGSALEAILYFRRLVESENASQRFGDELPLLYAAALKLAGRTNDAAESLARIEAKTWSEMGLDADQLLQSLPQSATRPNLVQEWRQRGGNAQRNGIQDADLPMTSVAWEVSNVIGSSEIEKTLYDLSKTKRGTGQLPTFQPLLVGDWVLFRSTSKLIGASMRRELGRSLEYPPYQDEDANLSSARREAVVQQRVWENSLYGQLSSDGQHVYLISEIPEVSRIRSPTLSNELVALELASEGKLKWKVGKNDDEDEPKLLGTFFLGAPLPLGESLFCVGERNSEIRVMELDRYTGKLLWSQQLGHVDAFGSLRFGRRLMMGVNLAYADGILVCPTGTGGVIGIDLAQRRLAWGTEYERELSLIARRGSRFPETWRDNGTVIDAGRVILSPWDSGELLCLDLLTGQRVWKQKVVRDTGLYVAGIHEGKVVVVGKGEVYALSLEDGQSVWKRKLRGAPSGRGVMTGEHYLLATTEPELVKIDLDNGKIVDSVPTLEPMGNLIASDEMIIAQNSLALRTFFQKDKLLTKLDRRLEENAEDPWALEHLGYVLLDQGKRKEGLARLQQAIANYPKLETPGLDFLARGRLADEVFDLLLTDQSAEAFEIADAAREVLPPSRQGEYLRVMTVRNLQEGRIEQAFRSNLELFLSSLERAETSMIEAPLMRFGRRQIHPNRWHRAMFAFAWNRADASQRERLQGILEARLADLPEGRVEALVQVGQDLPFLHRLYLDSIASQIQAQGRLPYLEGALLRLTESDDEQVAGYATALLGRLYLTTGQVVAAAGVFETLATRFADLELEAGVTGGQATQAALAENGSLRAYFEDRKDVAKADVDWGSGVVTTRREEQPPTASRASNIYGYSRSSTSLNGFSALDTAHGPESQLGLNWVMQAQGARLEIRDGLGQTVSTLGMMFGNSRVGRTPKLRTYGHLVVGVLDNSIVALNGLRDPTATSTAEIWRDVRASVLRGPSSPVTDITFGQLGIKRHLESGPNRRSILSLGGVSDRGVVFRRNGDLVCVDPGTGDLLWQRDDVRVEAEVWADDQYIFAHVDQRHAGGGGNARVFSVLDGSELESRPAPNQSSRVRTFGQYVLTWKRDLGHEFDLNDSPAGLDILNPSSRSPESRPQKKLAVKNVLELRDLFNRKQRFVWSRSLSEQARAAWLSYDQLAVYDPEDAVFEVISVRDGRSSVKVKMETELNQVDTLTVQRQAGVYLVSLGQNADGTVRGEVRYKSPVSRQSLQNIEVYALNDAGENIWGVPAKLVNFLPLPTQAPEVPLLVFGRKNETNTNRSKRLFEVVALDIRDGHSAFQSSDLFDASGKFRLSGRQGERYVELLVPTQNGKWTLSFTNEPRAPSVPYGYATNQATRAKKRTVLGALYDTIFPGTEIPSP